MAISILTTYRSVQPGHTVSSGKRLFFGASQPQEDSLELQHSTLQAPAQYSRFDNMVIKLVSGIYLRVPRLPSSWRHFLSPEKHSRLAGLDMKPAKIKTSDGIRLKGYWYPISQDGKPSTKTMIVGHGYCATAGCMAALVEPLHEAGWNVLAFDFRAHGGSKGSKSSLGYHEGKDIAATVKWLRTLHPAAAETTYYAAHSAGADAYLLAVDSLKHREEDMENLRHIKGVVLDSSYEVIKPSEDPYVTQLYAYPLPKRVKRWLGHIVKGFEVQSAQRMDLPRPLNELYPAEIYRESSEYGKIPMLLLHGRNDTRTPYTQGEAIHRILTQARGAERQERTGDDSDIQQAQPRKEITFVTLNADHFVTNWKPAGQKNEYKSVMRDKPTLVPALKNFLSRNTAEGPDAAKTAFS